MASLIDRYIATFKKNFETLSNDTNWFSITPTWVFLVEAGEGVFDDILWVCAVEFLPKHGEEHGEVDGTRRLPHHPL